MRHLQIRLEPCVHEALKKQARRKGESLSAVASKIVKREMADYIRTERAAGISIIGLGASGRKDIAVNHDAALAEDYLQFE